MQEHLDSMNVKQARILEQNTARVQAVVRGRAARREIALNDKREATVKIQSIYRQKSSKASVHKKRIEKDRDDAAVRLQAVARGRLVRTGGPSKKPAAVTKKAKAKRKRKKKKSTGTKKK